jgi:Stage II sporulation protein E (SpoIIE)
MGSDLNSVTVDVVTADRNRLPMLLTASAPATSAARLHRLQSPSSTQPTPRLRGRGPANAPTGADTIGGQAVASRPHFIACRFRLGPSDTLILYTDGLTETGIGIGIGTVGHERYHDEGALLRFAKAHSPTTAPAIVDAASRFLNGLGVGVEDDASVLAMAVPRRL